MLSIVESTTAQIHLPSSKYVYRQFGAAQVEFDRGYLFFACGSNGHQGEVHGQTADQLFVHVSTIAAADVAAYLSRIGNCTGGDCRAHAAAALAASANPRSLAKAA